MALATWWRLDPPPQLQSLSGFRVVRANSEDEQAQLNGLTLAEVRSRMNAGHRAYVGYLSGTPVTYGWVATQSASIGELSLTFTLTPGDRYLWDFATRPDWQGRGLYPRLLQAILEMEAAERFWIIHAPENLPSGAGMNKAGLLPVGQLSFQPDGSVGLAAFEAARGRAEVGAALLGVPLVETVLAPCWCCGGATQRRLTEAEADSCWPPLSPGTVSRCSCATPVKPSTV